MPAPKLLTYNAMRAEMVRADAAEAKLALALSALRELAKEHDGDCAVYPRWSHELSWEEDECYCFNRTAREALRKIEGV